MYIHVYSVHWLTSMNLFSVPQQKHHFIIINIELIISQIHFYVLNQCITYHWNGILIKINLKVNLTFPPFEIPYIGYLVNKINWYHNYHAQCTHHFFFQLLWMHSFSHGCDQQGESSTWSTLQVGNLIFLWVKLQINILKLVFMHKHKH